MICIGMLQNRLKFSALWKALLVSAFLWSFSSPVLALDRDLASTEIATLEANIRKDSQNLTSALFLIQHYYSKKQWADVIRIGQPLNEKLDKDYQIMLAEAYILTKDGVGAQNVLGFFHSKKGATGLSKMLESKAFVLVAQKEKLDPVKKMIALKAIGSLREAITLEPKNEDLYIEWINVLREFWTPFALDALNVVKVMEQASDDYESHIPLKCELYVKANLWDPGVVSCKRAINLNPRDVLSHLYFVEAQRVKVGIDEARRLLILYSAKFPESYDAQVHMAHFYFEEKNYVLAANFYKKALALNKEDPTAILNLAESEFQTQQYATALENFRLHCSRARMVASEFKDATKQLRSNPKLHRKYETAMSTCR
jgi:tetratricopeptide (TPR) repeat protein